MSRDENQTVVAVGKAVSIGPALGQMISVVQGTAWVTQGDERDLILTTGERATLDGPGEVVITALRRDVVIEVWAEPETRLAA